jgi:LysR family transcriptional regulator, carnitine catabolism transcriptional activator
MMLDQFRAFLAVAKHLSVREACADLHLTQSAISKRLKSLQLELGVELYTPNHHGIELTDAGRRALGKIELIVRQAENLKQAFRQTIPKEAQPLVVSIAGAFSLAAQLLPPVIARFEKAQAGVQVLCHTGSSQQIEQMVREGRAELGLSTYPPFAGDISAEPFRVQTLVFFVSSRHPLAKRRRLTLPDVLAWPLVIRSMMGGQTLVHGILKQLSERGLKYKVALECNGPLQVKETVGKNKFVGISYLENLKADVTSGRFVVLKGADFQFPTFSYILLSKKRGLSPAGLELLSLLRQTKKIPRGKRLEIMTVARKLRPVSTGQAEN